MTRQPALTVTAKVVHFLHYAVVPAADGVQMVTVFTDPREEAGALLDASARAAQFRRAQEKAAGDIW